MYNFKKEEKTYQEEIKELNEELEIRKRKTIRQDKEIERLNNIIKQAREYIYLHSTSRKFYINEIDKIKNSKPKFYGEITDILEILQGEDK